jgi:DNA polymerase III delta prime subunit
MDSIDDVHGLARNLRRLMELSVQTMTEEGAQSELARTVTGHLGCALSEVVPVSERFPIWENVNVQRGVDAYLAARAGQAEQGGDAWLGVPGAGHRPHEDLLGLITTRGAHGRASVAYATVAVGPDENTEIVTLGLIASTAPDGAPVVIGIRTDRDFGPPNCRLEVLAASREAATATRDEIERLIRVHDVYRGQVLSFGESEHHGNELVSFLPRPSLTDDDVVLPEGVLEAIERHIIDIAEWSEELLRSGQHVKRGLLLHGPPGTGKTHTVRYLTGRLTATTVILLTGSSIRFVDQAATLARRLQPAMVVLEDVDLIGADRDFDGGSPLLFSLLDAMDGVGSDADVTFVLTTNRADILERALADRPGRVDLAIEIPRPDAGCRQRLLHLYARHLTVDGDLAPVAQATDGVTASFIKELLRRVVLESLRAGDSPPVLRRGYFDEVLAEMDAEHQALTRSLLGSKRNRARRTVE